MASCLVPDFPAVMMALEHIGELDKQLKEEKVPFNPEASHHLKEIAAAVTKLETSRRSVHEQLEVETIENGKVRHQIHKLRDKMSQDIMADVTAAREANAKEIEDLHANLNSISERHKAIVNRQEELIRQNTLLYPERDRAKTKHESDTAALNHQISLKLSGQVRLQQTLSKVDELESCVAAAERDKMALERNTARERETFEAAKSRLLGEVERAAANALKQKQENARKTKKLNKSTNQLLDKDQRLAELTQRGDWLERASEALAASRGQHEEQLRDAARSHRDAAGRADATETELRDLRRHYRAAGQRLQEELIVVDHDLDEGRAAGAVHGEALSSAAESLKAQRREESEARAVHLGVSQRLERSALRLEERLATIARHRIEAREMEEEMGQLLEATLLNGALFQEGREKLRSRLELELRNLGEAEEEKGQLARLLREAKGGQEAHVAKATDDISGTRGRRQELCQEEVALRRSLSSTDELDGLSGRVTQAERDAAQMESGYRGQLEQLARDAQRVLRASEAKKTELEAREAALRQAEARYNREESALKGLQCLIAGLRREKSRLELSTVELQGNTGALLRPREEMKAELQAERVLHRALLLSQASELTAAEAGIRNSGRKLEQVSVENSRMRLRILKMREDIADAGRDTERRGERTAALGEAEEALFGRVVQAWREDLLVTREARGDDRPLVEAFGGLLGQLEDRSVQFEGLAARVQQQLLHISKIGY